MIRIADVHHYLSARPLFVADDAAINGEFNPALIDVFVRAFGT
jgi:hypothetical protein